MPDSNSPRVLIVGAGLAGLSAAAALSSRGLRVVLLESRPRLGGRASSIVDRETGETIDNCQHVSMGCCVNFQHFAELTGFADLFETQSALFFVGPPERDGVSTPRVVRFAGNLLPAPAHLATSLLAMSWFSLREKLQIVRAMRALSREPVTCDEPFANWLARHRQSEAVQQRFWHLVLVSALSETLDRISLKHARKVFVDGFLKHRSGWRVAIPTTPLDLIYETRLRDWLTGRGVDLRVKAGVSRLELADGCIVRAVLRSGETVEADQFIAAVPYQLVASLLPEPFAAHPDLAGIARLESAPIASVHLWFDRPVTELPHAVLLDRLSQWMFNRGERDGRWYVQVVISAANELQNRSEADVVEQVRCELLEALASPAHSVPVPGSTSTAGSTSTSGPTLLHGRLITEHRAVFAPVPGVDDLRPDQQSPIANLQLAGDWTKTGWPSTMEGAVRSGYLAAENVLNHLGQRAEFVQPDLPPSWLFRCLYSA